ncbi:hypothetical protein D0T49_03505 [Paludibacter sp. 221]|uniref:hypothetical protein n=1 Tax=Paludibacter sp. 221 TaxID=2302939 RepID=UPI0013D08553|nr:hypothetical protein [Paludibacter sp. 221]NDV46107.1 hypothetical protein [Paludibacter sp. 221]
MKGNTMEVKKGLTLMERISEFIRELKFHTKASFILYIEAIKLKLAIHLSDIKQKAKNRRFFVISMQVGIKENGDSIIRLRSIDNDGFKYCKRMGWLPKHMSYLELQQKCFYSTSLSRNNTQTTEEKKKAMEKYIRYQKMLNRVKL